MACEKETCVVECTHPRHDVCCPRCDMCSYEGDLHDNGESFQPDACKRCLCMVRNMGDVIRSSFFFFLFLSFRSWNDLHKILSDYVSMFYVCKMCMFCILFNFCKI